MKIIMNNVLPTNCNNNLGEIEINKSQFVNMMDKKKYAQTYDAKGVKTIVVKDNKIKRSGKPIRIKFEIMKGPFIITLFSTKDDVGSEYVYRGIIVFEEGDVVKIYRDSISQGYTEAYFCDDTIMLIQVKEKGGDMRYLQIAGEPTSLESWIYEQKDPTFELRQDYVNSTIEMINKKSNIENIKNYAIIQLE